MIDRTHELPITTQAGVLNISRGSVYYLPRPVSETDLAIMRRLDRLHLEHPFAGSRMLRGLLAAEGCKIGRRHVRTLMRRMGIEALYRRPRTTKPEPGHNICPYLLRGIEVTRPKYNLTYSLNRPATDAEVRRAAETAACARFIENLSNGYQTHLGERGTRLSSGQQQRLAIARAILVNPQLMIMGEATSSLDSITEHAVQTAMATFGRGRTMVVIAHRLATIKRADNIIVMDEGRTIEQGKHDALLAQRGRYWEMIEHQRLDIVDVPVDLPEPTSTLREDG
jgi:putative transposase